MAMIELRLIATISPALYGEVALVNWIRINDGAGPSVPLDSLIIVP
ncbi:MAG: hypothetical protein H6Q74_48 [Firmicutes bacterium]|nr:hypothetical protein [Bacillota bacterium]